MSAPLQKTSGAPVAQNKCATAGFRLQINLAAQERATARPAVEQERSKLDFFCSGGFRRNGEMPQRSNQEKFAMENKTTEELTEMLIAINDELFRRGENSMRLIRDHAFCRDQSGKIRRRADVGVVQ